MEHYDNLIQALDGLRAQGYTFDFDLLPDRLECQTRDIKIYPKEFIVDKHFIFEDDSDAMGQSIIYAISSPLNKIKGTLINGYGRNDDEISSELLEKLRLN